MINILDGVTIIMNNWLQVKNHEVVHFVTDEFHIRECEAFIDYANSNDIALKTTVLPSTQVQKGDIFDTLTSSFEKDDVIIGATNHSFITTKAVTNAVKHGTRFLSLPLSCDGSSLLERDFVKMDTRVAANMGEKIIDILNKSTKIHITTKLGTDLYLYKENRNASYFCGDCSKKGQMGSSSFEVFFAPNEGKAHGTVIVDGAVGYIGKFTEPTELIIEDGYIKSIEQTKSGILLKEFMDKFNDQLIYSVAELGIGLNRLSKCDGICYIEDESVYSTFHIGMGRNLSLGGVQNASGHFDIITHDPDIYADNIKIMEEGKLII